MANRKVHALEGCETPSAVVPARPTFARVITESLFYREGIENIDPPVLHYLHIGCWATQWCDYYVHRRPREGELRGHSVYWLHTAKPRDRFVFLVLPVDGGRPFPNFKQRLYHVIYGGSPRYAILRRTRVVNVDGVNQAIPRMPGVEVVEILHSDITALDYSPGLTTNRFSIETRRAVTRWFPTRAAAEDHYKCAPARGPIGGARTPDAKPQLTHSPVPPLAGMSRQESFGQNAGRLPPMQDLPPVMDETDSSQMSSPKMSNDSGVFFSPPRDVGFYDSLPRFHDNTMIVVYSQDPHFNAVLREVLQPTESYGRVVEEMSQPMFAASKESQVRLLHLYETGIPSWCIFFCRWGLPYRRWFRIVAVTSLNVWPFIALVVGLYDLYKHMPYLREFAPPFVDWMESHFTLRVSVAVAYIFTILFQALDTIVRLTKSVGAVFAFLMTPLTPLIQLFILLWSLVKWVASLASGLGTAFVMLWMTFKNFILPVSHGVQSVSTFAAMSAKMIQFWTQVARPVKNFLKAIYDGIVHVGSQIARREASWRMWYFQLPVRLWRKMEVWGEWIHEEARSPTWRSVVFFVLIALVIAIFMSRQHVLSLSEDL